MCKNVLIINTHLARDDGRHITGGDHRRPPFAGVGEEDEFDVFYHLCFPMAHPQHPGTMNARRSFGAFTWILLLLLIWKKITFFSQHIVFCWLNLCDFLENQMIFWRYMFVLISCRWGVCVNAWLSDWVVSVINFFF